MICTVLVLCIGHRMRTPPVDTGQPPYKIGLWTGLIYTVHWLERVTSQTLFTIAPPTQNLPRTVTKENGRSYNNIGEFRGTKNAIICMKQWKNSLSTALFFSFPLWLYTRIFGLPKLWAKTNPNVWIPSCPFCTAIFILPSQISHFGGAVVAWHISWSRYIYIFYVCRWWLNRYHFECGESVRLHCTI